jgi:hypothetical protein
MDSDSKITDLTEQLTKLAKLHQDGALSDEEFVALKARLISKVGSGQSNVSSKSSWTNSDNLSGAPSGNSVSASEDYSHLYVKDICSDEIIRKFVQDRKVTYYREKFQQLIDSAGIGNQTIANVDIPNIFKLWPLISSSQWNWSAFLANIYWGAWRGISNNWWFIAAYFSATFLIDVVGATGIAASFVPIYFALAYGNYGNKWFFGKIVKELKSGNIRREQTSMKDL